MTQVYEVRRYGKKVATFDAASEVWLFFSRVTEYDVTNCAEGGYSVHTYKGVAA